MEPSDFLEHEDEDETSAAPSNRRQHLMDRLAAARAELVWQILDADERTLSESPVFQEHHWTTKDLLAHIAAWDRWEHRTMVSLLAGNQPDLAAVGDTDAFNAAVLAEWQGRSLTEVLAELEHARTAWLTWLRQVPPDAFFRPRWFQDWDWAFPNCLEVQWKHDTEHAEHISAWREQEALQSSSGPKAVLSAALDAARQGLLTAAALVPPAERTSRRVCGEWTLKDVVGHLADWERVGVEGLTDMAAGRRPHCQHVADIDSWNRAHAAARRSDPWEDVWSDLHRVREKLASVLEGMSEEALARSYHFPWGPHGTAYKWVHVFVSHDREHAEDLRTAMVGCPQRNRAA